MWLAVAAALCTLLGFLIASLALDKGKSPADFLLHSCFILCLGVGGFSVVFLIARVLNLPHLFKADLLAITLLGAIRLLAGCPRKPSNRGLHEKLTFPAGIHRLLTVSFVFSASVAGYSAVTGAIVHPHGDGWDAFAIWNLHARFLFLGGARWRDGYSTLIPWSHPDYPPLVPAAVAHFWSYLGNDSPAIPAVLGFVFALSTVVLLCSALTRMRGGDAAMLGGLTLVSTPFFVSQAAAQYADIPLSFFFLSTLVLLYEYSTSGSKRTLALAGLCAGFAAWTKNEGLLFLFSAVIGQILPMLLGKRPVGTRKRREVFAFLIGAAPLLALDLWFKHFIAPPGDLFTTPASMISKAMTPLRYLVILKWFGKQFLRFGDWWLIPVTLVLVALYFLSSRNEKLREDAALHASLWTLALTLVGYFAIYVITPNELYWHLRFSLNRLLLQVWPSALFLFFCSVSLRRGPEVSK